MKCNCGSERIAQISGKTDDRCFVRLGNKEKNGYAPDGMNVGGGDYLNFKLCLDCGKIQGKFPVAQTEMEAINEEIDETEEVDKMYVANADGNWWKKN